MNGHQPVVFDFDEIASPIGKILIVVDEG